MRIEIHQSIHRQCGKGVYGVPGRGAPVVYPKAPERGFQRHQFQYFNIYLDHRRMFLGDQQNYTHSILPNFNVYQQIIWNEKEPLPFLQTYKISIFLQQKK